MDITVQDSNHEVIILDSSHRHKDKEGFLIIKNNPIACAGVFPFSRHQIGDSKSPDEIVAVYRSPQSVQDALEMFRNKPIVYNHKWVGKTGDTQQADGSIGSEVTYKDGVLYADLIIYNQDLIDAIESGVCKQLSPGYNAKITRDNGIYDNTVYNYSITYTGVNHLGVVEHGRAGSKLTILDEGKPMGNYNASTTTRHSKRINNNASSFVKVAKATDAKEDKKEVYKKTNKTQTQGALEIYRQAKERLKKGELNDEQIKGIKEQMSLNLMNKRLSYMKRQIDSLSKQNQEQETILKKQKDAEVALQTISKYIPNWIRKADTDADTNYRNAYTYLTKEKLPDGLDSKTAFITLCQSKKNINKDSKQTYKVNDSYHNEKLSFLSSVYEGAADKQRRINSMIKKGA